MARGEPRQRAARIVALQPGYGFGRGQARRPEHGDRPARDRVGDEVAAVGARSRHGCEKETGPDLPGIGGDAENLGIEVLGHPGDSGFGFDQGRQTHVPPNARSSKSIRCRASEPRAGRDHRMLAAITICSRTLGALSSICSTPSSGAMR
jgi:hypothetical protein